MNKSVIKGVLAGRWMACIESELMAKKRGALETATYWSARVQEVEQISKALGLGYIEKPETRSAPKGQRRT